MLRRCLFLRRAPRCSLRAKSTVFFTPEEHATAQKLSAELVDVAALHDTPSGWSSIHSAHTRLEHLVTSRQATQNASIEKEEFSVQAVGEGDDGHFKPLTPGTFIEIRRNCIMTRGVVLGETIEDSARLIIMFTTQGEIWSPLHSDVLFSVPAFIPEDLALRCSHEDVVYDKPKLDARVKVLKALRQMDRDLEVACNDLLRRSFDVYNAVRPRNPDAWGSTTCAEVARLFTHAPGVREIYAAHMYLLSNSDKFEIAEGYLLGQRLDVRPLSHVQNIRTVHDWVRAKDKRIQGFVGRAKTVIVENRAVRAETWDQPPSWRRSKQPWTTDDQIILTFLHRSLQPRRSVQSDPYVVQRNLILRMLDPNIEADDDVLHQFLMDLGMYAPWQDTMILRDGIRDIVESGNAPAVEALVQRSLSAPVQSGPMGPEDLYTTDPLDHLRHDFGDMPIYVIDGPDAKELDDGISVEHGDADSLWLHAHIADPTSTIPHTHAISARASKLNATTYFAHRTFPMLPESLINSGRQGFSLDPGKENRVLTISAKLDSAGEMLEYRVRPGIARNFVKLSYDQVTMGLEGFLHPPMTPTRRPSPPLTYTPLTESQLSDLRLLDLIRTRRIDRRCRLGRMDVSRTSAYVSRLEIPSDIESPTLHRGQFSGFPDVDYKVLSLANTSAGSEGIVSEAMKAASEAASAWCAERGIDVIRRASSPLEISPENLPRLLAMRDKHGFVDLGAAMRFAEALPAAENTLEPLAHWSLGIADGVGYTRVTSPLRRYSDLVTHYQIQASLLGKNPYFSTEQMNDLKDRWGYSERFEKRTNSIHQRFWAYYALKRFRETPEHLRPEGVPDPLEDLEVQLVQSVKRNNIAGFLQAQVHVPSLGLPATLVGISRNLRESDWRMGATIKVKFEGIKLGVKPMLYVKGTGSVPKY